MDEHTQPPPLARPEPQSVEGTRMFLEQALDITDRQRTDQELRASEERFRLLVESVQEYAIYTLDTQGFVTSWNAGAQRIEGYRAEEVIGRHFSCFFSDEDIGRGKPQHALLAAVAAGHFEEEDWRVRKDGSRFWASVTITALRDEHGRLLGFSKISRDMTDLRRADQRFRATVESAPNAMLMIDRQGRIVLVNAETKRLFGYKRHELMGQDVELLVPERFRGQHPQYRSGYFDNPQARRMGVGRDLYGLRKDGSEFPVEIGLNPVETEEGTFVLAAIVDITERKRTEEALHRAVKELEQKNNELAQFVYTVSHDLKSPLVTMTGFLGLLKEDLAQQRESDVQESLEHIENAVQRMTKLIHDLLQLSRVGQLQIERQEVDVAALVREIGGDLEERLTRVGAVLEIQDDMPPVCADRARLAEVFDNLLTNAIKYGCQGPEPKITVGGRIETGEIHYFVGDNGPGIAPQYQKKIFGLFQRLDSRQEGTGMGLAIVTRIMESHGGRAWVESGAGYGATFWLSLPVLSPVLSAVPQEADGSP